MSPAEPVPPVSEVRVGQDVGQQDRLVGVASVQEVVRCGRGRAAQEVMRQEHPAGRSQKVQTCGRLPLPLGPAEKPGQGQNRTRT